MISAILLDCNRVAMENGRLLPGVEAVIRELSSNYRLAMVSRSRRHLWERYREIERSGIARYFDTITVVEDNKSAAADEILRDLKIGSWELLVVDDRVTEGIAWANRNDCFGVWCRRGKFADVGPSEETGQPGATISDLSELVEVLAQLDRSYLGPGGRTCLTEDSDLEDWVYGVILDDFQRQSMREHLAWCKKCSVKVEVLRRDYLEADLAGVTFGR